MLPRFTFLTSFLPFAKLLNKSSIAFLSAAGIRLVSITALDTATVGLVFVGLVFVPFFLVT